MEVWLQQKPHIAVAAVIEAKLGSNFFIWTYTAYGQNTYYAFAYEGALNNAAIRTSVRWFICPMLQLRRMHFRAMVIIEY